MKKRLKPVTLNDVNSAKSKSSELFVMVIEPEEVLQYFAEGGRLHCNATLWIKGQRTFVAGRISLFEPGSRHFYFFPSSSPSDLQAFATKLNSLSTRECLMSLSLQRAKIFFVTQFLSEGKLGFKLKYPPRLYKVQRRHYLRLSVKAHSQALVSFEDPRSPSNTILKQISDISVGGLSFITLENEKSFLTLGMTLKNLTFSMKGRNIRTEGQIRFIRNTVSIRKTSRILVGLQFKNLSAADSTWIAAYIFEQSRRNFSRK